MAYTDNVRKTFPAGAALAANRLVKLDSGQAVYLASTATDMPLGVNEFLVESGSNAAVKLITSPGTLEVETDGAISAGAAVYAADDGLVQALPASAGTYRRIGTALVAATAAGDIIEVLPDDFITQTTV